MLKIRVNEKIYKHIDVSSSPVVVYGGSMAGKSYTIAQYIITKLLTKKQTALVLRKYASTLRYSVWKLFYTMLYNLGFRNFTRYSEMILENGSEIFFRGLDEVEKIKGIEASIVWMEEATEFSEEDYIQASLRARVGEKKVILSFNPLYREWLHKLILTYPSNTLKVTVWDNPFVSEEQIQILQKLQGVSRKIYLEGDFAKESERLVFKNPYILTKEQVNKLKFRDILWGVDFGYNNPTAIVKVGVTESGEYVVLEDYKISHITNADLVELLRQIGVKELIVADSSEPQRIVEIRNAGFSVVGSIKGRVFEQIQRLLQEKIYFSETAVNTLKEIETYSYKVNREGLIEDEIVKVNDHCIDAMRYAIIYSITVTFREVNFLVM
ncbi:MAG: PBSX family phage terminase large subunit [Brevinematia bacterium]